MLVFNEISPMTVRLLDATEQWSPHDALFPFAYEEVIGKGVSDGDAPMIHLWRHEKSFIMGLRDRKLPYAKQAMTWLESLGYKTIVRHSGGAAVPLDRGVVNVSLIFPKRASDMDFRREFDVMVAFLRRCLQPILQGDASPNSTNASPIHTGEIKGSYCPGDYDLSIDGRKFCGISQRRQTRSYIVQAFVNVEGSGMQRARLVEEFYSRASGDKVGGAANRNANSAANRNANLKVENKTVEAGLKIQPHTMASLSELTALKSAEQFIGMVKQTASQLFSDINDMDYYEPAMLEPTERMLNILRQRYDRESN